MYRGVKFRYEKGVFSANLSASFDASFTSPEVRTPADSPLFPNGLLEPSISIPIMVSATIGVKASAKQLTQSVLFAFNIAGQSYSFGPMAVTERLASLEDLAAYFLAHFKAVLDLFVRSALILGLDATFTWVKNQLALAGELAEVQLQKAARLFDYAGCQAETLARGFRDVYKQSVAQTFSTLQRHAALTVNEVASISRNIYSLAAKDTAALLKRLGYADKDAAAALKAAGYVKGEVEDAMNAVYDWGKDVVETVLGWF